MFVESKRGRREGCVVKMHSQLLPWIMYLYRVCQRTYRDFFLKRGESSEEQSDVCTYRSILVMMGAIRKAVLVAAVASAKIRQGR